jgi:hypothetical protein
MAEIGVHDADDVCGRGPEAFRDGRAEAQLARPMDDAHVATGGKTSSRPMPDAPHAAKSASVSSAIRSRSLYVGTTIVRSGRNVSPGECTPVL